MEEIHLHHSHKRGVRAVATLEILKGIAAVLAAIGLVYMLHRSDLGDVAEDIIFKLHLNPNSRLPWFIIDKAYDVNGKNLWLLIGVALGYALVRFAEGYGLWHERVWAEYFALFSGAAYIPVEIYELLHRHHPITLAILLINIGIVIYIAYVRFFDPNPP
jgi:uncharacterized membrane protein (DUF2068 family)